jgi:hypothetical protein
MPRAEEEAWEAACVAATNADGTVEEDRRFAVYKVEYERRLAERHERLMKGARATYSAMADWANVESAEHWQQLMEDAAAGLRDGAFLVERLGAERHLDPKLMATLLVLRQQLIDECGVPSAADIMLIDAAIIAYHHVLRTNGWIGNLATEIESEFFSKEGLHVVVDGRQRSTWDVRIKGLRVVEIVGQLDERILPLMDRSHRIMLRSLHALQTRKQRPAPAVTIAQAEQGQVAHQQINATGPGGAAQPSRSRSSGPDRSAVGAPSLAVVPMRADRG